MAGRRETNVEILFQEALRERIGERRFTMWFGAGVRFVFSESRLSVRVETSEFLCNWICSAFKHTLEQLCRDFFGRVALVEFLYVGGAGGAAPTDEFASRPVESTPLAPFPSDDVCATPAISPSAAPTAERENLRETFSNWNAETPRFDVDSSVLDVEPRASEPPKKRRGRPPKAKKTSETFFNAPEHEASGAFSSRVSTSASDEFGREKAFFEQSGGVSAPPVDPAPRRRRGRPRKNPLPETSLAASSAAPTSAVPIRSAFDLSFSDASNAQVGSDFGGALGKPKGVVDAFSGAGWDLSESERVSWAAGNFNETPPFNGSVGGVGGANAVKTPGKRGRKKAVPATRSSAPLFDVDDEGVSRDERGFNIVKKTQNQQNRTRSEVAAQNWASLDSFVEGFSNQLARKVVDVAIVQPATMSPIFIYGSTSVGKTHLLEGVCDRYRRVPGRKPPLLMTAEEFTSAFIQSLRGGGAFRERFRDVSLFALDDLHFLEGKITTQTELLNVVDFLRARRVQMIFAANRPLSELTKLRGELTTRIESGVSCKIETPERETLSKIFRQMALERRLVVPDDVCRYVVSRFATHARQLSGALNRLYAAHLTTGAPINLDLAQEALADMAAANVRHINLEDVERVVRETFGLDADSLKSKSRAKRCADPRALAMWLARKHTRSALAEIGKFFGGRQHSAVVFAQKKVDLWLQANETVDADGSSVSVADAVDRMERSLARPKV